VPLPLLPVVGACGVDCRVVSLLVVEFELELVVAELDVVVFRAVPEELDDLPAYEAAAT